jgi:membrane fusion protein (multidrug efflux system)
MTDSHAPGAGEAPAKPARKFSVRRLLMFVVPLIVLVAGGYMWLVSGRYASTDNAYVQQDVVAIVTEVAGRVTDVAVTENQPVKAGDLLFRIDPQSYKIALDQAEAAVGAARLKVEQDRATFRESEAALAAARDNLQYQQTVYDRVAKLARTGTAARSQLDEAQNALRTARQAVAQGEQAAAGALAALAGNPQIATDEHPNVRQAIAQRDKAALDLSHAELRAPVTGVVSQTDRLQQGQYLPAGSTALALVDAGDSWIEANFKETDLTHMRPGQPVTMSIEAYPDVKLKGQIASIGAGTGSEFSLLPAQNATGNWVKVVQRVPVRISIQNAPADLPLRAGLSASVEVDTGHIRPILAALRGVGTNDASAAPMASTAAK